MLPYWFVRSTKEQVLCRFVFRSDKLKIRLDSESPDQIGSTLTGIIVLTGGIAILSGCACAEVCTPASDDVTILLLTDDGAGAIGLAENKQKETFININHAQFLLTYLSIP